jgi:5-(carboxyamino)imidazole ribonucleotide synthase
MFTMRARSMGYRVVVLDPDPESPAGAVADRHVAAPYLDPEALSHLANTVAVATTEFENVPAEALARLAEAIPVRPPPLAVRTTQDRCTEKRFLEQAGLPTAPFHAVADADDLEAAWEVIGAPAILKTSRLGYDGKGQVVVDRREDARRAFAKLGGVPCVLERRLELKAEVSVILARAPDGTVAAFPVGENVHVGGILDTTVVPARVAPPVRDRALALATEVATRLEYVGVLGVELFVTAGDRVWINEIAPRPHNSGHYTLDACVPDQFEQQLRAICGLPLGEPTLLSPVAMANLLGDLWIAGEPPWNLALAVPGVSLHLYGKKEARPGRKMGHLTAVAPTPEVALERVLTARTALRSDRSLLDQPRGTARELPATPQ